MTVAEMMQELNNMDPFAEVVIHHPNSTKLNKVDSVFMGNEKFLPNGRKDQPNVAIIELK